MKRVVFLILSLCFSHTLVFAQENPFYENAYQAYERGDIDESYIHLKNSLRDNPDHLPSKILMGEVLALSGYYDDAEQELSESLQRGGDPNLIIDSLVNVYLIQQQYQKLINLSENQLTPNRLAKLLVAKGIASSALTDEAASIAFYERALQMAPDNTAILNSVANKYLSSNRIEEALSLVEKSIQQDSSQGETYRILSKIYAAKNETDKQVQALKQTLELFDSHPLALRDLVSVYLSQGQLQEAKIQLEHVLRSSPGDPMAQLLYSWVSAEMGNTELSEQTLEQLISNLSVLDDSVMNDNQDLLFIAGMANYASSNLELAKSNLSRYLAKNPENFNATKLLVDVYRREQNYVQAIGLMEQHQDLIRQDPNLINEVCDLYIRANMNHKCNLLIQRAESTLANNATFIKTKARLYAARGKLDLAISSLETLDDSDLSVRVQKSIYLLESGQLQEAESLVSAVLGENPDNPDLKNLLGSIYSQRGESLKATELFREIVSEYPEHFSARFNLAASELNSGNFEKANTLVKQLLSEQADNIQLMVLKGRIQAARGNTEAALDTLLAADARQANNEAVKEALVSLRIQRRENDLALSLLNELLRSNFLSPKYLRQRAMIYRALGQADKAKEDYKTLYGIHIDNAQELYDLSLMQTDAKDLEGSLKSLTRAIELSGNNFFYVRDKAALSLSLGNLSESKTLIALLDKEFANNPDVLLLKGDLALKQGKAERAADFYLNALQAQTQFAGAMIKSFQLAVSGTNREAFEQVFSRLANSPSENVFATHLLADYYLIQSQTEQAKRRYESIAEIDNYVARGRVLNNLANIYIEEGKLERARQIAEQAYVLERENAAILDTLGWIISLQGDYQKALDLLRRAYSMNTLDPNLRFHIAFTLHKLGRKTEARRVLLNLLNEFDGFDKQAQAQALLNELEREKS